MDSRASESLLSSADRFQAIIEPLAPAFAALDQFLEQQVGEFEPEVQPLVRFCFGHSGKKLRPILVFSMAMENGGLPDEPVIKAAAIVELVHLATLVHDDILDEADVRHRTETAVARYDSHVAVLLGDALFAHALHLAADYPEVEVCRVVSRATRQVCSGEIAQTFARGQEVPETPAYYRMIDLKTAELFTASAYLGGLLSGFEASELQAARDFARHLGIAYQIYDDAADIFGRESQAGKTLGTDLATGKFTLPVLLWLDSLDAAERSAALERLKTDSAARQELPDVLLAAGILTRVEGAFTEQLLLAREAVDRMPGTRRESLLRLSGFVESAWNKFSIQ
jgi:octaprenyl-diphosphate synthase